MKSDLVPILGQDEVDGEIADINTAMLAPDTYRENWTKRLEARWMKVLNINTVLLRLNTYVTHSYYERKEFFYQTFIDCVAFIMLGQ